MADSVAVLLLIVYCDICMLVISLGGTGGADTIHTSSDIGKKWDKPSLMGMKT